MNTFGLFPNRVWFRGLGAIVFSLGSLGGAVAFAEPNQQGIISVAANRPAPAVILVAEPGQPNHWWPSQAEREAVLEYVPDFATTCLDHSWDAFEMDKFLMYCSRSDLTTDDLRIRYPQVSAAVLNRSIELTSQLALASRLNQALLRYQRQELAPTEWSAYWRGLGLFEEELLQAIMDQQRNPPTTALKIDPFLDRFGRSPLRCASIPRADDQGDLKLRVYFQSAPDSETAPYLIYQFLKDGPHWRIHDIWVPSENTESPQASTLRQKLGLTD